jgi:hypothetical protein
MERVIGFALFFGAIALLIITLLPHIESVAPPEVQQHIKTVYSITGR